MLYYLYPSGINVKSLSVIINLFLFARIPVQSDGLGASIPTFLLNAGVKTIAPQYEEKFLFLRQCAANGFQRVPSTGRLTTNSLN
jgi:hypothetical protein